MTKVYLSGAITGIPIDEACQWRSDIMYKLYGFKVFDPTEHFEEQDLIDGTASDREIMDYELYELRHSDLVIFNCHYPKSIGSAMELAIAHENRIPILLFNEKGVNIHPWIKSMGLKEFKSIDDVCEYVKFHFE